MPTAIPSVMPYSEQFYIGGANSIRAFTIRSIGPGSYHPAQNDRNSYLDQTGDFNLEANVEFRFGIMGRLGGAVFLDAGNIWLLKTIRTVRAACSNGAVSSTRSRSEPGSGSVTTSATWYCAPISALRCTPLSESRQAGVLQHFEIQGRTRIPRGDRVSVLIRKAVFRRIVRIALCKRLLLQDKSDFHGYQTGYIRP